MDTPQEPRWLDSDEQQTFLALGSVLIRLPAALDAQLERDAGVSHFEYAVMAGLSQAPGRTLRMSVLAMLTEGSCHASPRSSGGWKNATGCAAPPTQLMAATPWRSSPRKAGPRSPQQRPGTSPRSAA
jgi:hypothetical protein